MGCQHVHVFVHLFFLLFSPADKVPFDSTMNNLSQVTVTPKAGAAALLVSQAPVVSRVPCMVIGRPRSPSRRIAVPRPFRPSFVFPRTETGPAGAVESIDWTTDSVRVVVPDPFCCAWLSRFALQPHLCHHILPSSRLHTTLPPSLRTQPVRLVWSREHRCSPLCLRRHYILWPPRHGASPLLPPCFNPRRPALDVTINGPVCQCIFFFFFSLLVFVSAMHSKYGEYGRFFWMMDACSACFLLR